MIVDKIVIYPVSLPFAVSFHHSMSRTAAAENVVVAVWAENGRIKGFGEGAPRPYVTGETQDTAVRHAAKIAALDNFPWQTSAVQDLSDFIDSFPESKSANAALCAVESALLDAYGKLHRTPIYTIFPQDHFSPNVHYGAPIPLADPRRIVQLCRTCKAMGIRTLKLKLDGDVEKSAGAMRAIESVLGDDYTLKVDVNGIWDSRTADAHLPLFERFKVRVVEQPMFPDDPHMPQIASALREMGIRVMADESVCTIEEVQRVLQERTYDMINVRLSKCGGFYKSIRLIEKIRKTGLAYQIGCHLGESGLLSAAGRVLSLLSNDALFHDGSYDAFLLKENITVDHVGFGTAGAAGPLPGSGLGVEINENALTAMSDPSRVIEISRCGG